MTAAEQRIQNAAAYIKSQTGLTPAMGLVLGSGLGGFADGLQDAVRLPFGDIPGFLAATAPGHAGALVLGRHGGQVVAALQGRVHLYEGAAPEDVVLPVRVMRALGVHTVLLTNAAGGINPRFAPGTLMLIEDHINLMSANPLVGPNPDGLGPRFPDMSAVYTPALREALALAASAQGIRLEKGVYLGCSGPSYETPAEIRAFRTLGADAVGMSTVPEAIAARHAGMRVLGISCITNPAAGMQAAALSHQEVLAASEQARGKFTKVVGLAIEIGVQTPDKP